MFPSGYTKGMSYPLGDFPTDVETGGAPIGARYSGTFRAVPTGEHRKPRKGEWYLSGAPHHVAAYRSGGVGGPYLIARLVKVQRIQANESYRIIQEI